MKWLALIIAMPVLCAWAAASGIPHGAGLDTLSAVVRTRSGFPHGGVQTHASSRLRVDEGTDWGEFLLDTTVVRFPASGDQILAAICAGVSNYLVVWYDAYRLMLFGARFTPEGEALDPGGFTISEIVGNVAWGWQVRIAHDGSQFLVVWGYSYNEYPSDLVDYRVYLSRVSDAGQVLDRGIRLGGGGSPSVAAASLGFRVAWQDRWNQGVYVAWVSPEGLIHDTVRVTARGYRPAVASDSGTVLVVWGEDRGQGSNIYGARVTAEGAVLDTAGIPISATLGAPRCPAVASSGTDWFVAWADLRGGVDLDIYGARVSPEGEVLDTAGVLVSVAEGDQNHPVVTSDGSTLLVVWDDKRRGTDEDIYGARVSFTGVLLDSAGIVVSTASRNRLLPDVASLGDGWMAAWQDARGEDCDVYAARVASSGEVLDTAGVMVTDGIAHEQAEPAVGASDDGYMVVWSDLRRYPQYDLYAVRVSAAGVLLDSSPVLVSCAEGDQKCPVVASSDSCYLIAWADTRDGWPADIYAARVTQQGQVLDTAGVLVSSQVAWWGVPAVAGNDTLFLVAWQAPGEVRVSRVSTGGCVLDPEGIPLTPGSTYSYGPEVAWGDPVFLVAWERFREIYAARITSAGEVLDTAGLLLSVSAGYGSGQPEVGFDGDNFVVTWECYELRGHSIRGSRVTIEGIVLDPGGIELVDYVENVIYGTGSLASDGDNYLYGWGWGRVQGLWFTRDFVPIRRELLVSQSGTQGFPSLACGEGGRMLLAYRGWAGVVDGRAYNSYRIWAKANLRAGVGEPLGWTPVFQARPATIVREALTLKTASGRAVGELRDVAGRRVMRLVEGANDISHLAPGAYFMRTQEGDAWSAARRVVVVR
ncbi:MAG: hypothetical protein R6X12_01950 [bacterium]